MSNYNAFLRPVSTEKTKEFVISDRFLEEDGKTPAKIKIKAIFQTENAAIIKASTHSEKDSRGNYYDKFDREEYHRRLIVECTVSPDFRDSKLCKTYNVVDPNDVAAEMFLAGEYAKLINEVMKLNGYKDIDELAEEAKNS